MGIKRIFHTCWRNEIASAPSGVIYGHAGHQSSQQASKSPHTLANTRSGSESMRYSKHLCLKTTNASWGEDVNLFVPRIRCSVGCDCFNRKRTSRITKRNTSVEDTRTAIKDGQVMKATVSIMEMLSKWLIAFFYYYILLWLHLFCDTIYDMSIHPYVSMLLLLGV